MPIYEYLCDACGHHLEILQSIKDEPLQTCPQCHKDSLKKLVSAAGFRLSGSGWYETDFKGDNKRNLTKQPSDSGSTKQSDSKQAAKAAKATKDTSASASATKTATTNSES